MEVIHTYIHAFIHTYSTVHIYKNKNEKHLSDFAALVAIRAMLVMERMRELVDDDPAHTP